MGTLEDARMPSLRDKHLAGAAEVEAEKADIEAKKGKGRIKKSKSKN